MTASLKTLPRGVELNSFDGEPLSRGLFASHMLGILKFWERARDDEGGGFHCSIGGDGRLYHYPWGGKPLVMQARLLYNYSEGIRFGYDFSASHADHLYRYLLESMQAPGGWYCSERRGELRSPEMLVTYDNLFVVIGMARYAQATGRKDVLGEAWRLFELIEEKTVVGELSENGVNGAWSQSAGRGDDPYSPHQYSGNTVLHYLEALSCLAAAGIGTDLSGRVKGIRALFTKYFVSESPFCVHGYFGDSFADPYTGVGASFSLGHALEWIDFFRCFPGLELPGSVERKILDFAIAAGVQPNGLFMDNYYINEQGSAGECEFWPQVEAAKTFNLACSVYGEPYGEVFRKMARCYFDLWVDDDGGVFHSIDRNGIVIERRKGDHWKCDYHSMRLCVEVLERDGGALPQ